MNKSLGSMKINEHLPTCNLRNKRFPQYLLAKAGLKFLINSNSWTSSNIHRAFVKWHYPHYPTSICKVAAISTQDLQFSKYQRTSCMRKSFWRKNQEVEKVILHSLNLNPFEQLGLRTLSREKHIEAWSIGNGTSQ